MLKSTGASWYNWENWQLQAFQTHFRYGAAKFRTVTNKNCLMLFRIIFGDNSYLAEMVLLQIIEIECESS